ncbi:MAG: hypothetical protein RIC55_01845 [Pirellulaceae bacterium]
MTVSRTDISNAIDHHGDWILQQPGVAGCDNSNDEQGNPCLRVFTDGISDATKNDIKQRVQPIPVRFEETGPIRAQASYL